MKPTIDHLASKVDFGPGCWQWTGPVDRQGYGRLTPDWSKRREISALAHRAIYQVFVGDIPEGLVLDHLCRNTGCVNPDHLEVVTPAENVARGASWAVTNAQKTHCHKGHEFNSQNTYRIPTGRMCRACNRDAVQRYRARRRAGTESKQVAYLPEGVPIS